MLKITVFFIIMFLFMACGSVKTENILNDMDNNIADEEIFEADELYPDDDGLLLKDDLQDADDETAEFSDEQNEDDYTDDDIDRSDETDDSQDETDTDCIADDHDTVMPDDDSDAGEEVPLDGFGIIAGECGVFDDELISENSFFFMNSIDFITDPYDETDYPFLTAGGQEILDSVNAGNAVYSKVFAYELLARCEFAELLKTESEIGYDPDTGRTDLLVSIGGLKIGVSVTKAVKYPFDAEYTVTDAQNLLTAKLTDIIESSKNVIPDDKWEKQILHVIAYSDQHAVSLRSAYDSLDDTVRTDTIVMVTVSNGDDSFLY